MFKYNNPNLFHFNSLFSCERKQLRVTLICIIITILYEYLMIIILRATKHDNLYNCVGVLK